LPWDNDRELYEIIQIRLQFFLLSILLFSQINSSIRL
jgi:hypothetical protein